MAKKKFISPFVLMDEWIPTPPPTPTEPATFSGQGGVPTDPEETLAPNRAMVYGEYVARVGADMDGNGTTDYEDYSQWMTKNGFAAQITPKSNPES